MSGFTSGVAPLPLAAAVVLFATLAAFAEPEAKIVALAPEWQVVALDGKTVKSSDLKGKVVILNFWATWCVPCREEIPGLVELQKQYGEQGLAIVGVSVDQGKPESVTRFVERFKMNYLVAIADEKIVNDFGSVDAIPTTFIIDKQGRIVSRHTGFAEKDVFEREIKPLL
ncbi:MAG: TlpA family protein disulfide reductase [Chthoniobacterales bacterium]